MRKTSFLKRTVFSFTVLVLAFVLLVLLTFIVSPYKCCLDVLNAAIKNQVTFKPFYGGTTETPPVRDLIHSIGDLEDAFPQIRLEMEAILLDRDRIPFMYDAYDNIFFKTSHKSTCSNALWQLASELIYGPDTNIFDRIGSKNWRTFNLIMFNQDVPRNAERCPVTVDCLKKIPGMQSALFSIIAPGTYIPPHNDPGKGVVRYHLALKVPKDREKCFISVNGEKYCWTEGKSVLFDDVFDHWVLNDTLEERVVLFVDILRPLKGWASFLQGAANVAAHHYPGVKRAVEASKVTTA